MRRAGSLVLVLGLVAWLLAGCSFWDWLAGRPITPPDDAPAAPQQPSSEPQSGDQDTPPSPDGNAGPAEPPQGAGGEADGGDQAAQPGEGGAAPGAPGGVPSGPFPEVTIPPVDEAAEDPSFHAFHQELLRIIEARDVDGLLAIVDPAVRNDFGGGGGIDDFRSRWGLEGEQAASSPVWPLLSDLLELGGVFTDGGQAFVAPYVFVLYDQYADELDPFYHSVVTGAGVNVRAAPSLDSAVLERVSHLVVRVLPADGERETTVTIDGRSYAWKKIQLPSGTIGYLADKYLWSPVGYRVRFDRHDDGWRLTFLLAGD